MNVKALLKSAQLYSLRNSPSLLTAVGVLGVVTTSVLAARAGFRSGMDASTQYHEEIHFGQKSVDEAANLLERKHLAETYWKEFVPPAIVGAVTLAAIIGANHIGSRRAVALATAFKVSEQMADEYRAKVLEHVGPNQEEVIRSEVAHDRIGRVDGVDGLILTGSQEIYYDSWSGRAFLATREQVEQAVNQINYSINQQWSASLSEFYDLLGLSRTAVSDEFGWNSDELLEPYYSPTFVGDRKPAVEIRYNTLPFREFGKIGI